MEKRINFRRRLDSNRRKKKIAKIGVISTLGILGITGSTTAFATEWTANTPASIQIEQGATSYTMKQGDTLWAIGMKINVNVNTLASINNVALTNNQQYSMPIGTIIHFSESEIKATNSTGQSINKGVKANDSNKIVANKPIGTDVSKDVTDGNVSNNSVIGKPNNTGNLPKPNTGGNTSNVGDNSSNGGSNGNVGNNNGGETPVDPEKPVNPTDPTNVDKFVTINVDEDGNVLDSTEGYNFESESTDKKVVKDDKSNTVTTYTTTKVWAKIYVPVNEDKYVTVNVDTEGNILSSTDGYSYVSESTTSGVQTMPNGDTVTTYTTTVVWSKNEVTPPSEFYVGQVLYSESFATADEADAHIDEIEDEWYAYMYANNISLKLGWSGSVGNYVVYVTVTAVS